MKYMKYTVYATW